jgi:hypothetical protein
MEGEKAENKAACSRQGRNSTPQASMHIMAAGMVIPGSMGFSSRQRIEGNS